MTVIAFDGVTLASDSRCTDGADNNEVRKIWRLKNGYLFGGAGEAGFCAAVRHWLEISIGRKRSPDKPSIYGDTLPTFAGLLIRPDGMCFLLDPHLAPIETLGGPQAVGSGASHAITLMRNGHSAASAVKTIVDQQLADGVGGAIQTITLRRKRARTPAR